MRGERDVIEPLQIEQYDLAPMAEDDTQVRQPIEHTREDQTDELDARFIVPTDSGLPDQEIQRFAQAFVHRHANGRMRRLRMEIERSTQCCRGLVNRREVGMIEIPFSRSPEDHRAVEAELAEPAFDFARCFIR